MDIVRNPDAPPPLAWYGRKKYGRLRWARTPAVVWTFGTKSLNVQNHGLRKFGSINFFLLNISGWVGRWPYSFSVLNHAYHYETEILFRYLQNKLLYKKLVWTRSSNPPPLYTCPYLSSIKILAAALTPPSFRTMSKISFFYGFPKIISQKRERAKKK